MRLRDAAGPARHTRGWGFTVWATELGVEAGWRAGRGTSLGGTSGDSGEVGEAMHVALRRKQRETDCIPLGTGCEVEGKGKVGGVGLTPRPHA